MRTEIQMFHVTFAIIYHKNHPVVSLNLPSSGISQLLHPAWLVLSHSVHCSMDIWGIHPRFPDPKYHSVNGVYIYIYMYVHTFIHKYNCILCMIIHTYNSIFVSIKVNYSWVKPTVYLLVHPS